MTDRLTGLALLQHHEQSWLSNREKAIKAGYYTMFDNGVKADVFGYFEAVLDEKQYQQRRGFQHDEGGSQTCKDLITAIKEAKDWKKRNDKIYADRTGEICHKIEIYFHGNMYCYIKLGKLYIVVEERHKTKSTKERLNRILMKFCGCQVYQKKEKWYIFNPQIGDIEYKYGMAIELFV